MTVQRDYFLSRKSEEETRMPRFSPRRKKGKGKSVVEAFSFERERKLCTWAMLLLLLPPALPVMLLLLLLSRSSGSQREKHPVGSLEISQTLSKVPRVLSFKAKRRGRIVV